MELIEGVSLSNLCDYSFGDQSGQWSSIYTSFMTPANLTNTEFVSKLFEVQKSRDYMTLFIDNIRLYKRDIKTVSDGDRPYVEQLMDESDLLSLCSNFPDMKFIIFTNLEDTPTDEYIFDAIPENVIRIVAANAVANGGKVIPAPYGVQRRMQSNDYRIEHLQKAMLSSIPLLDSKLLYISHQESSERAGIKDMFAEQEWATVNYDRVDYSTFLYNICQHKFMICPIGNAVDCHRNWEVLYLRRVPVMETDPYLIDLFDDYPVLWVSGYEDITEDLLRLNNHLFEEAQTMDLDQLSLSHFFEKWTKN